MGSFSRRLKDSIVKLGQQGAPDPAPPKDAEWPSDEVVELLVPLDDTPTSMLQRSALGHQNTTVEWVPGESGGKVEVRYPVARVVAGPDLGGFVQLFENIDLTVGRDPNCDLVLEDPSVSRRHARLRFLPDERCEVQDLDSTNGVRLGSRFIEQVVVEAGAKIRVGNVSLQVDMMGLPEVEHLKRVGERLRMAQNRDRLTGLPDRAFLEDALPKMVAECQGKGRPISAAFLDIDHFKKVNDSFGHAIGDAVLKQVARIALHACRQHDVWIRYGGEEFVLFMPDTDEEGAMVVAERVRDAFLLYDWECTQKGLSVTASLGLALLGEGESIDAWLQRADQALYRAKHAGRNRVER